ncbi:MAG: TraV family lipoprotein [Alphaproteobacteria bacterium]|nr:TraV family lipoprotein [Alphaproteobacteria bacterium]
MRNYLYVLPILALTACTDYSNAFDCPPKPGMGCRSISEIHEQIIEHPKGEDELNVSTDAEDTECANGKCPKVSVTRRIGLPELAPSKGYLVTAGSDHVHRIPERVIRIWVNGRVNEGGDYEAPHYVYVALKNDGWRRLKHEGVVNDDD